MLLKLLSAPIRFLFWAFFPNSTRDRSIRLSVLIVLMFGLAFAALAFKNIDINLPGGAGLQREGTGPLGLKLGLDLEGGGQLIYQADTGTRLDMTFQDPINPLLVEQSMQDLRFGEVGEPFGEFSLEIRSGSVAARIVQVSTDLLEEDDPRLTDFQRSLGGALSTLKDSPVNISSLRVVNVGSSTQFHVIFEDDPSVQVTVEDVQNALAGLVFGEEDLQLDATVEEFVGFTNYRLETPLILDAGDPRRTEFQETVEAQLGATITSFEADIIDTPTSDQMNGALDIINRRVNLFGTDEPVIQRFGDDRIIVQLPGASGSITTVVFAEPITTTDDGPTLESVLTDAGYEDVEIEQPDSRTYRIQSATVNAAAREAARQGLEDAFGSVADFEVSSAIDNAKVVIGNTAQLVFRERTCTDVACTDYTDTDIGLSGDDLSQAYARADQVGTGWEVVVHFDGRGTEIFSDLTQRINQQPTKRIAIFLDDQLILAPVAQAHIRDGVTRITGGFTREEAGNFAIQLEAGRLPVPLKLIQENDVSALLGAESLRNSLIAGLVGLGLVIAFMMAYYRMAGVVAAVALIFYAVVELAIFKLVPITLSLSHIGGFILSIGMAVDANVLIFERMKEETRVGRTLASAMEVGFNRAWPAIRDGNISTLITCGVLLWFGDRLGGGLVTGFAISLGIGVLLSMFTAVVLSRNLLQLLAWAGLRNRVGLFTPEGVSRVAPTPGGGR